MLNVPELREKLHAARHKDSEIAYLARKHMGPILDAVERLQNDPEELGKPPLIHAVDHDVRTAAIQASKYLIGVKDQFAENMLVADNLVSNPEAWKRDRDKIPPTERAVLDKFHGYGECPDCCH